MGSQSPAQLYARPMSNHTRIGDGTQSGNALFGGGGGGGGGGGSSISRLQSLGRGGSVTLNDLMEPEVPLQAFGSINMDEFLDNIWTLEESQAMASVNPYWAPERAADVGSRLAKDDGLVAQPSTPHTRVAPNAGINAAGDPSDRGNDRSVRMWPGSLAASLSLSPATDSEARAQKPVMEDVEWSRNSQQQNFQSDVIERSLAQWAGQMEIQSMPQARDPVSDAAGHRHRNFGVDGSMRGRRRGTDGRVEKVVERRQLRMIKNRDSAARSRARKQAYTVELEAEVTQLKEDNNRLKTQLEEEAQTYKKLYLETIKAKKRSKPVLRRLRRTTSGRY